ncbi:MAG: Flp pilus assembly complex ATPase component TadA [Bacteroidales bacterium]|nr:Flp pilus assembly complex ATPase component TadA [Bacteroidales bacterium]
MSTATPNDSNKPNPTAKPGLPANAPRPTAPAANPGAAKPGLPAGTPRPTAPAANPGAAKPGLPAGTPRPTAPAANPGAAKPGLPAGTPRPAAPTAKPGQPSTAPRPGTPTAQRPQAPSANRPTAPQAPAAQRPQAPKPAPAKNRFAHIDKPTKDLGQKLVDLGYLDDAQLESIYDDMRTLEAKLHEVVKERGLVTDEQMLQATAELHGMKMSTLEDANPDAESIKMVPQNMAELYKLVPLSFDAGTLTVAMSDPNNLQALDDIRNFLSIMQVNAVLAPAAAVDALMQKAYVGTQDESIANIIAELENEGVGKKKKKKPSGGGLGKEASIDLDDLQEIANSAPVRKLINMVLLMAIRDHASDIHFEPFEDEYKMRYKCDGVLYEMVPPPRHLANAISSRIKVMSNLDIAERRLPQDGRIELNVGGARIDMRVSILPTLFGESVVIRVLDKSSVGLQLDRIGMPPNILDSFRQVIKKPNGIVLVTGPTGSGKTTTLYSALSELNDIETKIITTEDPVEYEIDGLVQCQIQSEIDLTFAAALRAILRQDPDVILIGEIRDLETAQIAIQASLTGHLVFSTLHTNDAPSSITRLRDMGVEPFLITATVEAIQAQRLVRRVCQLCRTPYEPTKDQLMELNMTHDQLKGRKFYFGEGCSKCNNLGFKGRTGLYELVLINDDIRDLISRGASTDQLRDYCRKIGYQGLRDAGIQALYDGVTTLDEVVRETVVDD